MHCTFFQLTLSELSPLQSSVLLVQVFQTRNIYSHFVDGVDILWLVQFLVSSTWTSFFLPQPIISGASYFFLWSDLFYSKVWSSRFLGYAMVKIFIIASHPAVVKKRSAISFSPPFSLSSFSFLILALEAKHRIQVSTKSGSSIDNWYPINIIVVMCKVSTS